MLAVASTKNYPDLQTRFVLKREKVCGIYGYAYDPLCPALISTLRRCVIVEKCRERTMESLDRANRLECEINLIGGAHSKMDPLARVMGSTD